jgi:tRNA(Ile)-lysidine synthase
MNVLKLLGSDLELLGLLPPGERVLVGVSGGCDSICLLHALHALGVPVVVAHFDHGLRRSSWADGRHVLRFAARLGLPAVAERTELEGQKVGLGSLEDRARRARYRFLASAARAAACQTIAVGHTQDDQAETVLMHLLRGSGTRGLRGMTVACRLDEVTGETQDADLRLVRPLLGIPREETLAYCRQHRLAIRIDPTNEQPAFLRNRVRLELLPLLATYNPAVRQTLARTADILASEAQALESLLGLVLPELTGPPAPDRVEVDQAKLLGLPPGIQRVILREILRDLSGEGAEVGFQAVERARASLRSERRTSLPGDVEMRADAGSVVFTRGSRIQPDTGAYPQFDGIAELGLSIPFRVRLGNGWWLEAAEEAARGAQGFRTDARWETAFDAEAFGRNATLRSPKAGDRMTPFGAVGSKKLSDLFQEANIPAAARPRWPIVCQSGSVAWLVGLRRAEGARVEQRTRRVLRLRLIPPGD